MPSYPTAGRQFSESLKKAVRTAGIVAGALDGVELGLRRHATAAQRDLVVVVEKLDVYEVQPGAFCAALMAVRFHPKSRASPSAGVNLFCVDAVRAAVAELRDSINSVSKELRDLVQSSRDEIDRKIDAAAQTGAETADRVRREFGETVQAMQNKIHEFEKWSRDTFVKRDSFLHVTNEVKEEP